MRLTRSTLLCACVAVAATCVPFLGASTRPAIARNAAAAFKVVALQVQAHDDFDDAGAHDLNNVIPSGKFVYYEEYVRIVHHVSHPAGRVEFWLFAPNGFFSTSGKVIYHNNVPLRLGFEHDGSLLKIKLTHLKYTLPSGAIAKPLTLRSRFTYGGISKTQALALMVCKPSKIHCHM